MLIYETDDSDFADSAIEALTRAGIASYRTGGALPGGSELTVCIHIRDANDFQRANEILIQQGAIVDSPPDVSPKLIVAGIIIGALLVAVIVAGLVK